MNGAGSVLECRRLSFRVGAGAGGTHRRPKCVAGTGPVLEPATIGGGACTAQSGNRHRPKIESVHATFETDKSPYFSGQIICCMKRGLLFDFVRNILTFAEDKV